MIAIEHSSENKASLSALDSICYLMDQPKRPLDFSLVLCLSEVPSLSRLQLGARSATRRYPMSGSTIEGAYWVRQTGQENPIRLIPVDTDTAAFRATQNFINAALDLRRQLPVQQLVLPNGSKFVLVTRFHHAAADGVSAAMWLSHQLAVARGDEDSITEAEPFQRLSLRTRSSRAPKSPFAFVGPSARLWTSGRDKTGWRRWKTIRLEFGNLNDRMRQSGHLTLDDVLATCVLQTLVRWNRMHRASPKIGLWVPINVRKARFCGFGNGTSRIRVYWSPSHDSPSYLEKCRLIQRQIFWCIRNGEWAVPQNTPHERWPLRIRSLVLRSYLRRPWIDMGSAAFSHAHGFGPYQEQLFRDLESIDCIGQLDERHAVVINGVTNGGQTWLTFTYDPGLLRSEDIHSLVELLHKELECAKRELT